MRLDLGREAAGQCQQPSDYGCDPQHAKYLLWRRGECRGGQRVWLLKEGPDRRGAGPREETRLGVSEKWRSAVSCRPVRARGSPALLAGDLSQVGDDLPALVGLLDVKRH